MSIKLSHWSPLALVMRSYPKPNDGLFQKKICNPPVEDINGNFQGSGVKVKVVRIPGGTSRIEETGNPGRSTSIKSISSTGGRYNFFLEKSPIFIQ